MTHEPSPTSASRESLLRGLLEQALDSGASAAELCPHDPALRAELDARLRRVRSLDAEVNAIFPTPGPTTPRLATKHARTPSSELPQIPGHHIERVIAHGGMGVVYKARHLRLNRPVAIKMLLAGAFATPQELQCLLREAESVARLHHPHIVQVYEVGDIDGQPYFSMEYLDGGTLAASLANTPQPARHAAELARTLADAVEAAHRAGVVHRDLKPGNILLSADGDLKIADFSLARETTGPAITQHAARLGTPSYMSPEQAEGRADAMSPAVDIYSLGAILYECLTGRPPFRADTSEETRRQVVHDDPAPPRRLNTKVPRDLETICLKALHKDPARRYSSAAALRDDLARYLASEPIRARPTSPLERGLKWARRHPASAAILCSSLILLVTAASAAAWWQQFDAQQRVEQATRQGRARQLIESAFLEADERRASERWADGLRILADAAERTPDADDAALTSRLEQKSLWLKTGRDLEAIRQSRYNEFGSADLATMHSRYAAALAAAGIDPILDSAPDSAHLAATIAAADIAPQLIAALDDWALVASDLSNPSLADTLLSITRAAAPNPAWADYLRTRANWNDPAQLLALAQHAADAQPQPHLLGLLGMLLVRHANVTTADGTSEDLRRRCAFAATELLADAHLRHPSDFWVIWELTQQRRRNKQFAEAVTLARTAVALRPSSSLALNALGIMLTENGDADEAIATYRRSISLDPTLYLPRSNTIYTEANWGRWARAKHAYDDAIAADPTAFDGVPLMYAAILVAHDRHDEVVPVLSRLKGLRPNDISIRGSLATSLALLKRYDHAESELRACLRIDPKHVLSLGWLGWVHRDTARNEDAIDALRRAVQLDASKALFQQDLGRVLLFVGRPQESLAPLESALKLMPNNTGIVVDIAAAHLAQGDWDAARASIARALAMLIDPHERFAALRLSQLTTALPAFSSDQLSTTLPDDTAPALIHWHARHTRRTAHASNLAAAFLATNPHPDSPSFFEHAAAAAALAGSGIGGGAASLSDTERAAHCARALTWLNREIDQLTIQARSTTPAHRASAFDAARDIRGSRDFAAFREPQFTPRLPLPEQKDWAALWSRLQSIIDTDPADQFTAARKHADHARWPQAAAAYAVALQDPELDNAEVWYEYAATQLLSDDRAGYDETCEQMVARGKSPSPHRPFLVLRTCTLGPANPETLTAAVALAQRDLARTDHWALTQLAATRCRTGHPDQALAPIDRSNLANRSPGSAILNWLWEAAAYRALGHHTDAHRLITKAHDWLTPLEALPRKHIEMGLHRHNWLEAHVLLTELAPAGIKPE